MPIITVFIFGAIIIGAGALIAPAWPSTQPRIALSAALALALVMGGALFWAMLFGWDTLVIDYLLFALVSVIFLGGTLAIAQHRAEARGEAYSDSAAGWPGPRDLLLLALVALVFVIPVLVLPVPLDTDAQGFGYLALTLKLGGSFTTLAPFHSEISYLYAPGFTALAAYLSQQLGQGLHQVQMAIGAVLGLLLVWLAYDFGAEWQDKRLGRAMALAMLGGLGLYSAYMDAHYTTLLGLVFALAFLIYVLRYLRDRLVADAVAAGLLLGAVVLAHPDTTIILGLGYGAWLLTMWLGRPRPTGRTWLVLALGVPLLALAAIAPWLWRVRDLLGSDIISPFERDPNHWQVMVLYHGVWVVPVAMLGALAGLRRRNQAALLASGWLLLVIDFAALGLLERLVPWLVAPLLRYDYPFSIAWHGPIIPYSILGGMGLLWLWDKLFERRLGGALHRYAYGLLVVLIVLALAGLIFNRQLLAWSKGRVGFYGAFASHADVEAMMWLRDHTPPDARILNFPGPQEGDWVAVIAERDSVYYRWQPFFRGEEASLAEQERLRAFWEDPTDPAHEALLRAHRIAYIIVPQVVTDPQSIEAMFRWRPPFAEALAMRSRVSEAPYLELILDVDGAQVYRLRSD